MPVTVIGVLPPTYRHLEINPERAADIFTPFRWDTAQPNRGGHFIRGVARLKDDVGLDQGRAELESIAARLEQQYPSENTDQGVRADYLLQQMVGESKPVVMLLAGAVIVVLLVACANVANLLLARGTGRLRELALRAAIGADRGRLVRQMLTESMALSAIGAAGGLVVALFATRALTVLAAAGIPRADQVSMDGAVLAFAVAAALITSVIFGLVPAIHLSRQDLNDALKEGGRQQGAAVGRGARELLIVAEVALSIVLLVGAGLMLRSLWQLQDVNPGFNAEKVLTMEVSLPTARYEEGTQMPFYQQLEERIRGLAGVVEVGAINILPLSSNYDSQGIQIEDHPAPEGQGPAAQVRSITPGYFRADGHPAAARTRVQRPRRCGRPAGGDRQRVDGEEVLAGRDRRHRQARHTQQQRATRTPAARRRRRIARRGRRGRRREAPRPRGGGGADDVQAAHAAGVVSHHARW